MTIAENVTNTAPSATNSTSVMLAANVGRIGALFTNDGTSTVWLKIGVDAVANEGITLSAGSSFYIGDPYTNLSRLVVNGITASATVVVTVTEWYND